MGLKGGGKFDTLWSDPDLPLSYETIPGLGGTKTFSRI
jgi:hypothetical protein